MPSAVTSGILPAWGMSSEIAPTEPLRQSNSLFLALQQICLESTELGSKRHSLSPKPLSLADAATTDTQHLPRGAELGCALLVCSNLATHLARHCVIQGLLCTRCLTDVLLRALYTFCKMRGDIKAVLMRGRMQDRFDMLADLWISVSVQSFLTQRWSLQSDGDVASVTEV